MKTFVYASALVLPLSLLPNCKKDSESMTLAEAKQALDESQLSSQAMNLTSSSVDISTHFTIGDAVEAAADELRTFIQSQLPCADIQVAKGELDVTYGAKEGNCTYRGHTYSGNHHMTVVRNDEGDVQVDHAWTALSNGTVEVSGSATVTWNFAEGERQVKHELTWTRLSDGKQGVGSGDRTQSVLEGGLFEGIQVDGSREWKSDGGQWDLAIDGVQMRWVDAVPQAGAYVLRTPKGKTATLSFERVDTTKIQVTVKSGDKSFDFNVITLPTE
ncbi:MAG: hypothetical protein KC492_40935 [Myxococcales bacterium]|nr:hypothetical protein [Myxococcales bacterium]